MNYDFIFSCYAGSRLQGLATPDSDWDLVAVTWEPKERLFTTQAPFESFESTTVEDSKIYGLRFFCRQLLKCNPNYIELLWCPVEKADIWTPTWERLLDIRKCFLSQQARKVYWGYGNTQLKKIEERSFGEKGKTSSHAKYIEKHGWDTKAGYHLMRLLMQGKVLLEGNAPIPVLTGETLKFIASIRDGRYTYAQFTEMVKFAIKELDEVKSPLPEYPDQEKVDSFLVDAYTAYVCSGE